MNDHDLSTRLSKFKLFRHVYIIVYICLSIGNRLGEKVYVIYALLIKIICVSFIVERCFVEINAISPLANDFIRLYLITDIYVHLTTRSIAIIALVGLSWMSVDSLVIVRCFLLFFVLSITLSQSFVGYIALKV